jgi:hypothetical protein
VNATTKLDGLVPADGDDRASRRFTRVFLAALAAGLGLSATLAWYTDPLRTFGTGHAGSFLTVEFDLKPEAFLRLDPSPQAIVLGTSRVMKLKPECITELTGYSAFNFGLTSSRVEDWSAAYRFVRARGHAPIRQLVIGADIDGFDNHAATEPRLLSSVYLRQYLDDSWNMSWGVAARALFGWQAFKYGMLLMWYQVHPSSRPAPKMSFDPRGFVLYDYWERMIREGKADRDDAFDKNAGKLRDQLSGRGFDALSPRRVALFQDMVRTAHAEGATIDVFIPPLTSEFAGLRSGPIASRIPDLEVMLSALEREGTIRLFRVHSIADFHGDPAGYYDGLHMTEDNATRLLLTMFHREHGCGH